MVTNLCIFIPALDERLNGCHTWCIDAHFNHSDFTSYSQNASHNTICSNCN